MIIIKEGYGRKERKILENILYNVVDLYGDFYCTKDNIRIYLRDNPEVLFDYLSKGDKVVYDTVSEAGLAFVTGWSDKSPRKYVKILTKDEKLASNFLKIISWNVKSDLYVKIKKNNPLIKAFNRNNYVFKGDRGTEILLFRQYIPRPDRPIYKGEDENER